MTTPSADFDLISALEERAFNAWPAQKSALCGGWLLRLSEGYTKRANSANALHPTMAFSETLQVVESFYARHGLPAIFRLSPLAGAEPDRVLDQAGYRKLGHTLVMTASLAASAQVSIAHDVTIEAAASDAWSAGIAETNGIPSASRATHDCMLAAITMPAAFATLTENETPVAYGLAVAENGTVGLFDIVVAPDARRRGVATKLIAALLEWGQAQRATRAYLQVVADNLPAISLYRKLGFDEQYQYHYRIRP